MGELSKTSGCLTLKNQEPSFYNSTILINYITGVKIPITVTIIDTNSMMITNKLSLLEFNSNMVFL